MTVNLSTIRFRAYAADEDQTVPDPTGGGGGGGGGFTGFSSINEAFAPTSDGVGGYFWWSLVGAGAGGTITPDAWQHAVFTYLLHADGSNDQSLTLDGTLAWSTIGGDPGGDPALPTGVAFGVVFGGGLGDPIYLDEIMFDGVLLDDFEGGSLAAWDSVVDLTSISTDQAHNGTHSLKCASDPVTGNGYVVHAFTAAYETTYTCDLWVRLPIAALVDDDAYRVITFVH